MTTGRRVAFIFPGQGAQYVGMGRDFWERFSIVRQTFEEAEDLLGRPLADLLFQGPESALTETRNSQPAIYVLCVAYLRALAEQLPGLRPSVCAGLSLGEYTALTASGRLDFRDGLPLVDARARYMNEACNAKKGTMAVIMGLEAATVESMVRELQLPHDLWSANFNCPGQVVISGTEKGVAAGVEEAKKRGAKRALPLQVHGAFHSGLMEEARRRLSEKIAQAPLRESEIRLVMNVPGAFVSSTDEIRRFLTRQVTEPVRWEQGIRAVDAAGVDLYVEIGCGKTLSGMNKRIGVQAPTEGVERVEDLERLATLVG